MPASGRALADLAAVLDAIPLRWYVFGAQAAIHYGSPRSTADVDVTVELGGLDASQLVERLAARGMPARVPLTAAFVAGARVLPLVHTATAMGLDLVLAGPGPEELFLARARREILDGVEVPIAAPTDLVVMKVLAGRPKDVEDLVAILRARPEGLDVPEAEALLTELEDALGQADLVPLLRRVMDRAR